MKPENKCVNTDCIRNEPKEESGCNFLGWNEDVTECEIFLSEPKESAWEMFRELSLKHGQVFLNSVGAVITGITKMECKTATELLAFPEPEVIKIMKEIQEEIE